MSRGGQMSDLPRSNPDLLTAPYELPVWCSWCSGEVWRGWERLRGGVIRLVLICQHCSHIVALCDVDVVTERPA